MALNAGKILKISITLDSGKKILEYTQKYLANPEKKTAKSGSNRQKPLVIVTPNPEQVVYARENPFFAGMLNRADIALPDGIGIVWAYRLLHPQRRGDTVSKSIQRIPGIEFMQTLVGIASQRSYRIGLIGGRGGLAVKAFECLRLQHPGLTGWAEDGPEVEVVKSELRMVNTDQNRHHDRALSIQHSNEKDYFVGLGQKIRKTNTTMIFVGLGAPKQEYFIEKLRQELSGQRVVLMSVGGSFDIVTGRVSRAPLPLRLLGFEWLWRLVREPWRWRRQLALLQFGLSVVRKKMG